MKKLYSLFVLLNIILIPLSSQQGLVAYFPFNGNTSDSTGNSHHITSNGVSYTFDRFGNPNSAAEFNGQKNTSAFKGFHMTDPGSTIAFWIRPDKNTDTIMVNSFPRSLKMVLRIVNQKYDLEISIGFKKIHLESSIPINFDSENIEYDFIAIHYKKDENSVLLNVNQRSSDIHYFTPGELDNFFPLTVKNDPVFLFKGKVDDIRIYSRTLSYDELNTLNRDRIKRVPEIRINSVYIGFDYAKLHTSLIDDYSSRIKEYGICLNTHPNLDTSDTKFKFIGYFDMYFLSGLLPGTEYYIRVYGKNEAGIGFSNEVKFKTRHDIFGSLKDIDGNVYKTIKIGTQTWMAENLKTTKYADGTPMKNGDIVDTAIGKYYFHHIGDLKPYGLFYTWAAAVNNDTLYKTFPNGVQGVCPAGWHLPNISDYTVLIDYLGGPEIAGQKLKSSGDAFWEIGNGTNESGFGGMGLGIILKRSGVKYPYYNTLENAYFWTSEADTSTTNELNWAKVMELSNDVTAYIHPYLHIHAGASVRCLKNDDSTTPAEENKPASATFFMYPNPAADKLHFPNLSGSAIITIYDSQSRIRLKTNVTDGDIDISFLPKGIYFIHISDGTTTDKKKFVK